MKKLLIIVLSIFALTSCKGYQDGEYSLEVTIVEGLSLIETDTLFISNEGYTNNLSPFFQAAPLKGGKAIFKGVVTTPQFVRVLADVNFNGVSRTSICRLFLEEGKIKAKISMSNESLDFEVEGGSVQTQINAFLDLRDNLSESYGMDSLGANYASLTPEQTQEFRRLYFMIEDSVKAAEARYIEANPTSLFALQNFFTTFENDMTIEQAEQALQSFKAVEEFSENEMIGAAEAVIEQLKGLVVGGIAPDFTQNDVDGKPITFSDVYSKNKVTMIDFWASWCGPCRRFNPDLVEIYKKYHRKGLEVLAVSLDRDEEAWIQAIKDDKLNWLHVSDLNFWNNAVAQLYRIHYIPQNVFVDSQGKIIAKQLHSKEDIEKLLEENL